MEEKIELQYKVVPEKVKTWKKITDFLQNYEYKFSVLDVDSSPAKPDASITIEMPVIDISGETFKNFLEILPELSSLSFKNSGNGDSVIMRVAVSGVWEAVQKDE